MLPAPEIRHPSGSDLIDPSEFRQDAKVMPESDVSPFRQPRNRFLRDRRPTELLMNGIFSFKDFYRGAGPAGIEGGCKSLQIRRSSSSPSRTIFGAN